jgi:hypothetical protein
MAVVAATLVAVWPPEPDTDRLILVEDGVPLATEIVYRTDASLCAVWEIPVATGSSYHAIAVDTAGNESAASNFAGSPDIQRVQCLRRQLAGLSCP